MIFSSDEKLPVGKIYIPKNMSDAKRNRIIPQPVFIVREATEEEFFDFVKSQGTVIYDWDKAPYYYEISTD